jgi:hypothetical protein
MSCLLCVVKFRLQKPFSLTQVSFALCLLFLPLLELNVCLINDIIHTVIWYNSAFIIVVRICLHLLKAYLVSDLFLGHFADKVRNTRPKVTVDILTLDKVVTRGNFRCFLLEMCWQGALSKWMVKFEVCFVSCPEKKRRDTKSLPTRGRLSNLLTIKVVFSSTRTVRRIRLSHVSWLILHADGRECTLSLRLELPRLLSVNRNTLRSGRVVKCGRHLGVSGHDTLTLEH